MNIKEIKAYVSADQQGKIRFSMKKLIDAVYLVRKVMLDTVPTKDMLELLNSKSFNDPNNLDYGICYYLLEDGTLCIVPEESEIPEISPCCETLELKSMCNEVFAWCKNITYRIVKNNIDKIEINLDISSEKEYQKHEKEIVETIYMLRSLNYNPRVYTPCCDSYKSIRFYV